MTYACRGSFFSSRSFSFPDANACRQGIFNTLAVSTYVFIRIFEKHELLKANRYERKSYFQFVRTDQDIVRMR